MGASRIIADNIQNTGATVSETMTNFLANAPEAGARADQGRATVASTRNVTPALGESVNVSSITDNGNNDWSLNWTSNYASGYYCPATLLCEDDNSIPTGGYAGTQASYVTTSSFRVVNTTHAGGTFSTAIGVEGWYRTVVNGGAFA